MDDGPSQPGILKKLQTVFKRKSRDLIVNKFEEDVQELIDEGAEKGVITSNEGEMIQSIFGLGETLSREIMVPRTDMVAMPIDATLDEVIKLALDYGHSRLPVYEENIDNIIGILHVKALLGHWGHSPDKPLPRDILRKPYFIPETKKLVNLLTELRAEKTHMAIVLDEYGGTAGLVTIEDIIEEIVGEIQDEYDAEDQKIIPIDDNTILVDARLHLEELAQYLNITLPGGNYESVGGFIIDQFGKVPQENEELEYFDIHITIRSADERKISKVEIKRLDRNDASKTETV